MVLRVFIRLVLILRRLKRLDFLRGVSYGLKKPEFGLIFSRGVGLVGTDSGIGEPCAIYFLYESGPESGESCPSPTLWLSIWVVASSVSGVRPLEDSLRGCLGDLPERLLTGLPRPALAALRAYSKAGEEKLLLICDVTAGAACLTAERGR